MNTTRLMKILTLMAEAGEVHDVCAEHDQLFIAPPDTIDPDSDLGEKLKAAGATYNRSEGWFVYT